ncbi:hypothetical protein PABG_12501 [Paracoccidioides brasiliensis Pb03]|nr:hypothetical protein PABG_12501 [Paracoccidioides brasiliensis Pb03]
MLKGLVCQSVESGGRRKVKCFNCGKKGRFAKECKEAGKDGESSEDKLSPRAEEGIFFGYTESQNQCLVYTQKKLVIKVTSPKFVETAKISNPGGEKQGGANEEFESLIDLPTLNSSVNLTPRTVEISDSDSESGNERPR